MIDKIKKIGRLEIIVFVSGTVVMVLELIGSRILAPVLGTSIFVWTSLIGLILGALSLGYYLGGYFSKNNPSYKFLSLVLMLSGIFIIAIAIIKDLVLNLSSNLGIKFGSILAATLLFVLPSILLGMISPYSVRLKIKNLETAGSAAGNLYALSTLGSIVGTFLAGFWLIPHFGSLMIIFSLGLILILTSFLAWPKHYQLFRLLILILILLIWLTIRYLSTRQSFVLDTDSSYNHIRVFDKNENQTGRKVRFLNIGSEIHSVIYLDNGEIKTLYTKFSRLDRLYNPKIKNSLVIGGGAYLQPRDLIKRFPGIVVDVAEIDPQVTQTAKDYFALADTNQINIYHQDGRFYLNYNFKKYDSIYLDAFLSSYSIPFQLTTLESAQKLYQALNNNGLVIINLVSSLDGPKSLFFKAEYKTLSVIFPQIYVFPITSQDPNLLQNIMIIASKDSTRLKADDLLKLASSEEERLYLSHLYEQGIDISLVNVLTDDFAPVDYYISKFF